MLSDFFKAMIYYYLYQLSYFACIISYLAAMLQSFKQGHEFSIKVLQTYTHNKEITRIFLEKFADIKNYTTSKCLCCF